MHFESDDGRIAMRLSTRSSDDMEGLIQFVARDEWRIRFENVLDFHFGPAQEAFNLGFNEVADTLGDRTTLLWGCAFEDFLTHTLQSEACNVVDIYLKKRSWTKSLKPKAYLRALGAPIMSLYEIIEVQPGKGFRARDLVRGGDPVLIAEQRSTQCVKTSDRIAARVLPGREGNTLTVGLLPFSVEASTLLLKEIRRETGQQDMASAVDEEKLRRAAPLFTTAWLYDVLPSAVGARSPVS